MKETIMILDGEKYTLFHGARLTLATPKVVAETLARLEGYNSPVIAFIHEDGSFGGCCSVGHLENDERYNKLEHKQTTNIKYTRWACGLITSKQL